MQPVWLSGWYFFYFAFIGAYLPYFGLYLESIGLDASQIGILMSVGQLMRMLVPALWGWLSDRSGRRGPWIRGSVAVATVAFGGYLTADAFFPLLLVSVVLHLFWSASLPLVEALTFAHLGRAADRYARIRLWGSIGFIVAVGGIGQLLEGRPLSDLLWYSWALLGLTFAMSVKLAETSSPVPVAVSGVARELREPRVVALMIAGFCMAAAHGPLYVFYSIHLAASGYDTALIGMLWSLGVIAEIGVFIAMPRLNRRFDVRTTLVACFALAVLRFLLIGWMADGLLVLVFAQMLHGATFGAHHAATVGALNRWFVPAHQGTVLAIYGSLSFGAGGMLGALLSGVLWDSAGAGVTFTVGAAFAAAGLLFAVLRLPAESLAVR